jgi:drug/metabolite transporter (DMT)-like permease
LVQLRLTISTICLFVWLVIRHPRLLKIPAKDLLYFVVLGSCAMASVQFTYLLAISKINVAAAILLQYLAPSIIAIYSVVFARERLRCATALAVFGAAIGCYLVVGAYNFDMLALNVTGIASGLLSAIAFAWYSVQGEYGMRRYGPWTVLFYAMLFGALTWNLFHPPLEAFTHAYTPVEWAWILYIALLGTLVPFGLYFEGISRIRSTRASVTATIEPITAGILSYIFLREIMEPLQVLGGILVIASIILLQVKQEIDPKAPSAIRLQAKCGAKGIAHGGKEMC